ncbi:hypothetical protein C8R32_1392 [Nitrosospira sp. Nsp5]|uniref:DUF4398 domain-containing protein n=1 Tax=Nitrosospira multiformis TaxID=1231 RepID=A0ABY0TI77_9PROT|nr:MULTISPECIES: hypothetical protein [Nitrosospira]PTR05017.1 hypothetical protein C8R32_1392 [Nitrosospira sp. Nsp5]SDQ84555.1 hypothetical protein SAMN05216402_2523 [Nitrosospira multiformis]
MKKQTGKFIVVVSMLGLLASCAQMAPFEAQNADTRRVAENARTYFDHDTVARQYEITARELLAEVERQKKLLEHYEDKSYLYGKRAQDMRAHTWALLRRYEMAAEETVKRAALHQKISSELARNDHAKRVN